MVLHAGHTGASSRQVFGLTKLHGEDLRNTVHSTNLASFLEPGVSLLGIQEPHTAT